MCAAAASGDTQRDEADEDEADETARAASIADEEERADGEDRRATTEPGSPTPTPNVLTRGAAARNEPSPGTEAFDPALARLARGYPHEGHHAQPETQGNRLLCAQDPRPSLPLGLPPTLHSGD